jgi:hypothetical protein
LPNPAREVAEEIPPSWRGFCQTKSDPKGEAIPTKTKPVNLKKIKNSTEIGKSSCKINGNQSQKAIKEL